MYNWESIITIILSDNKWSINQLTVQKQNKKKEETKANQAVSPSHAVTTVPLDDHNQQWFYTFW